MNSFERTHAFIRGDKVDRTPFHPILMRWAAKYAGVPYRDFCLDPKAHCEANIKCAGDFDIDWVNVMSDPYAEAEAFGLKLEYPADSLPVETEPLIKNPDDIKNLKKPADFEHRRLAGRIDQIRYFKEKLGDTTLISGWVEGPLAEYCDLRGLGSACMDFYDNPSMMEKAMDIIVDFSMDFVTEQVKAGANCIGMGDAACSQIGPQLYKKYIWEREKIVIDHIRSLGVLAKLHICGNTTSILTDMIATGSDIVDIDHLVKDMGPFADLLGPGQVLCGKSDPVSVIQNGSEAEIIESVTACSEQANGRCIISAGCEITPGTSVSNMKTFSRTAN